MKLGVGLAGMEPYKVLGSQCLGFRVQGLGFRLRRVRGLSPAPASCARIGKSEDGNKAS